MLTVCRYEGGIRGIGWIVAPGRLKPGSKFDHLMHVTDWLPTLAEAAGLELTMPALRHGLRSIDGVSHWKVLHAAGNDPINAVSLKPARSEILINIDGVNGTGTAAIRVGKYKLLRSQLLHKPQPHLSQNQSQEGQSLEIPSLGFSGWCDVCTLPAGCPWLMGGKPHSVDFGGTICTNTTSNSTAASLKPNYSAAPCGSNADGTESYLCFLYDIQNDPSESDNLATKHPDVLQRLLARLAHYQTSNVPCCSCTIKPDTREMNRPPKDGVWYTFHDQSDLTPEEAPLCDLLRQPPF